MIAKFPAVRSTRSRRSACSGESASATVSLGLSIVLFFGCSSRSDQPQQTITSNTEENQTTEKTPAPLPSAELPPILEILHMAEMFARQADELGLLLDIVSAYAKAGDRDSAALEGV